MQPTDAKVLFDKYQSGECSPEELAIVENWLTFGEATDLDLSDQELSRDLAELRRRISRIPVRPSLLWPKVVAAAAAVVIAIFGVYFLSNKYNELGVEPKNAVAVSDIKPGRNGATIRLANGKVIQLSDQKTGVIVGEDLKYSDGASVLSAEANAKDVDPSEPGMTNGMTLTASTSRGQTYQFTLPDGTKVWLNAESSISFPAQFNGKERKILLSGEAYFAVVHNDKQPFRVESKGSNGNAQVVEDIGTAFNINAYADENSIRTTLIEGSARVLLFRANAKDLNVTLKPNQQAILANNNIQLQAADVEQAVAWKNGEFVFNSEPVPAIMRRIGRWYNVEITYQGDVGDETFTGTISRYSTVEEVLETLALTKGVKFKIEGRKIIVSK